MEYKGYSARIRYDKRARLFYGLVADISDVLIFQGRSILELNESFQASIDGYMQFCNHEGIEIEFPDPWRLIVSIDPKTHEAVRTNAKAKMLTLDQYVEEILKKEVSLTNS